VHRAFWWENLWGKRLLGRSRRKCDGSIEMYLDGIGLEDVVWIVVAQDREKIADSCVLGNEQPVWTP
jgi:predicted RNA-binding protein